MVLWAEYSKFKERTRKGLQRLRNSKRWLSLNRLLLNKVPARTNMPPLKDGDSRARDPTLKANLLAETLLAKSALPPAPVQLPDFPRRETTLRLAEFFMVRTRTAGKILRELQLGTATGIDQLPVRWFKECADVLAVGAMLARKVVTDGKRPACWKMHSVVPLHKRGSVFDKLNYRGAHLTTILSKVVERLVAHTVFLFLEATSAFGHSQ